MNCTVAFCKRSYYAKGFCQYHYDNNRRRGDPLKDPVLAKEQPCTIEGCSKLQKTRGWCETHYMRWRRHGDPLNPGKNRFDGKAKERNRARTAKWKKTNKATYNVYLAARKSRLKQATPPWADLQAIEAFYAARENSEVDHIIPITHPDVCGLHVPWNLQYLAPVDNNMKNNRFDGTYANESWRTYLEVWKKHLAA